MDAVGIPTDLLTPIAAPGARIGAYQGIDVILPACHDTGSAVVAVPSTTETYAYLSSGTWSLLGLELDAPIISDASYAANLTNEGGYGGTWRLLKNIMGLWLVDQCRATWAAQGNDYSFAQLSAMVESADQFSAFIDPDDPRSCRRAICLRASSTTAAARGKHCPIATPTSWRLSTAAWPTNIALSWSS